MKTSPKTFFSCADCIIGSLAAAGYEKKKSCCKKYKHGKRCKKCPKSSK